MMPAQPPPWVARYIGLPFRDLGRALDGLDCWGLARLVLEREAGVTGLPDLGTRYVTARDRGLPAVFRDEMARWHPVSEPALFDVVVLRIAGQPRHVGVVVARKLMLTIDRKTMSCLERLDGARWAGRVEGYYRHA